MGSRLAVRAALRPVTPRTARSRERAEDVVLGLLHLRGRAERHQVTQILVRVGEHGPLPGHEHDPLEGLEPGAARVDVLAGVDQGAQLPPRGGHQVDLAGPEAAQQLGGGRPAVAGRLGGHPLGGLALRQVDGEEERVVAARAPVRGDPPGPRHERAGVGAQPLAVEQLPEVHLVALDGVAQLVGERGHPGRVHGSAGDGVPGQEHSGLLERLADGGGQHATGALGGVELREGAVGVHGLVRQPQAPAPVGQIRALPQSVRQVVRGVHAAAGEGRGVGAEGHGPGAADGEHRGLAAGPGPDQHEGGGGHRRDPGPVLGGRRLGGRGGGAHGASSVRAIMVRTHGPTTAAPAAPARGSCGPDVRGPVVCSVSHRARGGGPGARPRPKEERP
jgi:hypothetical protein